MDWYARFYYFLVMEMKFDTLNPWLSLDGNIAILLG